MKRIISFLLILALLICLVACGNDGESSSSESQAEQSSTETQSESMESESVTESETQGNTSSESATESESQSQSTESVTESETNSQSTETATESEQESESTTESETESEIESESSTEIESETESESESENQNPTTVAEWVEANKEQIKAHMNSNYLSTFGKKGIGVKFDANKVADVQWIFKGEDKVENVKMILTYKTSDTIESIRVVSYNFDEPINGEDFLKTAPSITASELKSDYSFAYDLTIQGTRDELVTALFKAVGVNEVGGPRYLKDNGEGTMDYGKTHGYTIVEVADNEIKEYSIRIIHTSAYLEDEQAIQKLENPAEFKITDSKEVDISGASVEYVAQ